MDIFAPSYYKQFKCLADKCNNNCCIGWEIDIDQQTLAFYNRHNDISKNISFDNTPHFILDKHQRCPFLNDNNLCNIILNHGEDALCDICKEHPRFINVYDSRAEIGLGLTCEAAVELILKNDFELIKINADNSESEISLDDQEFFSYREQILKNNVFCYKNVLPNISLSDAARFLKNLERLDNRWDNYLSLHYDSYVPVKDVFAEDTALAKRLFSYFIFRHLQEKGLSFCVFCTLFVLSYNEDIYEAARIFSSEIEYSEENTYAVYDYLN